MRSEMNQCCDKLSTSAPDFLASAPKFLKPATTCGVCPDNILSRPATFCRLAHFCMPTFQVKMPGERGRGQGRVRRGGGRGARRILNFSPTAQPEPQR